MTLSRGPECGGWLDSMEKWRSLDGKEEPDSSFTTYFKAAEDAAVLLQKIGEGVSVAQKWVISNRRRSASSWVGRFLWRVIIYTATYLHWINRSNRHLLFSRLKSRSFRSLLQSSSCHQQRIPSSIRLWLAVSQDVQELFLLEIFLIFVLKMTSFVSSCHWEGYWMFQSHARTKLVSCMVLWSLNHSKRQKKWLKNIMVIYLWGDI